MLVRVITMVSFVIPNDIKQLQDFELKNDLTEWEKNETSSLITYINVSISTVTGVQDENK